METVPAGPDEPPPHWIACPVEATLDVIGGRWKGVILDHLMEMHATSKSDAAA